MTEIQLINKLLPIMLQAFMAFVVAMLLTPVYTHFAYKYKAWKILRTTTTTGEQAVVLNKLHAEKHKRHIPTMAGIIAIVTIALVTLTTNWTRAQTYLPLFGLVAAGAVGLLDDFINIRGKGLGVAGLRGKIKFWLIFTVATIGALYFYYKLGFSIIHIPAHGDFDLGWLYIPLFIVVVVSTANAVNITDGLDGLAGGLLAIAFGVFGIIAFAEGQYGLAGFCAAIVGAVLAYTWFNIFPARFLMGDAGSFALGTTLGIVAMLTNSVFVLPIIGGVFVLDTLSAILQIFSKKVFHRKIFLSAPAHHHLEAIGWPEAKVTMRLWIIGAVFGMLGLIIGLLARG